MDAIIEKRQALQAAEELLERHDNGLLRYAVLELRRCLEAVVYEKLFAYKDRLPQKITRTWQPPQAFKALVQLEPGAQRSSGWTIARQGGEPAPVYSLGQDLRPDPDWLTKTWNKLGAYLHAQWPFARQTVRDDEVTRSYLEEIAKQLHPFVDRSFTSSMASTVTLQCSECGSLISANEAGVKDRGYMTCLNPSCDVRYDAEVDGTDIRFRLAAAEMECPDCTAMIYVPNNKMKVDHKFACRSCGAAFEVLRQVWESEKITPGNVTAPGSEQ